eukprot:1152913-Pelagomonas_calceolata.AAC.1
MQSLSFFQHTLLFTLHTLPVRPGTTGLAMGSSTEFIHSRAQLKPHSVHEMRSLCACFPANFEVHLSASSWVRRLPLLELLKQWSNAGRNAHAAREAIHCSLSNSSQDSESCSMSEGETAHTVKHG